MSANTGRLIIQFDAKIITLENVRHIIVAEGCSIEQELTGLPLLLVCVPAGRELEYADRFWAHEGIGAFASGPISRPPC